MNCISAVDGVDVNIPSISNLVRSSPTTAHFNVLRGSSLLNGVFEVSYYQNSVNGSFEEVRILKLILLHYFVNLYCQKLQSDPLGTFETSQPQVIINNLTPCLSYWVVVSVLGCVHRVHSSPQLIGPSDSMLSDFVVSVERGASNIVVSWRNSNAEQRLETIQVNVTSECPTGVVATQHQTFNVAPDEGNSVSTRELGIH